MAAWGERVSFLWSLGVWPCIDCLYLSGWPLTEWAALIRLTNYKKERRWHEAENEYVLEDCGGGDYKAHHIHVQNSPRMNKKNGRKIATQTHNLKFTRPRHCAC